MNQQSHSAFSKSGLLIGLVVMLAAVIGVVVVVQIRPFGEQGSGLPQSFDYDLDELGKIDPALIGYQQTSEIALAMTEPRAVAVGPDDRIYVIGDRAMSVFAPDETKLSQIALDDEPQCLAVRHDGGVYVGMKDHVEVYDPSGARVADWQSLGDRAVLTSIASAEQHVFVADAGNKIVWRYDINGELLGKIGERNEKKEATGFVIPSPYFDVAMAPDGLLRVVNPGVHHIQAYTVEGDEETPLKWGKRSITVKGFCGCCNPAAIAILPDGRIVTGEKGIPRVKVYGALGEFECVVAGPDTFAPTPTSTAETRVPHKLKVIDLAADSEGRIMVLDPSAKRIRIFEPKEEAEEDIEMGGNDEQPL